MKRGTSQRREVCESENPQPPIVSSKRWIELLGLRPRAGGGLSGPVVSRPTSTIFAEIPFLLLLIAGLS